MSFEEKLVLVTGAGSGIGRTISYYFFVHGVKKIVGTAKNEKVSKKFSKYIGKKGKGFILNVMNNKSMIKLLSLIRSEFGEIDILINNIGIKRDNLLIRMKDQDWNDIINTNLTSVFIISKYVIRAMLKNKFGRIINIGSVFGNIGNIGQSNYTAAKAGLIGFSKSLAREVASRGITVNVVAPGFIETEMTRKLKENQREVLLNLVPARRIGEKKEIASAVIYLASDSAKYITGETLHVNGGMYMI